MRRRAHLVAEDRVLSVLAGLGVAAVAAVEEAREVEPPVPAPRRLEEIAADRAHRAQLRRRGEPTRLTQRLRDLWVDFELRERRACTNTHARRSSRDVTRTRSVDPARQDLSQLDERVGA